MTDLDKLDALAAAATPGPWAAVRIPEAKDDWWSVGSTANDEDVALTGEADAAFIAACDPATIRDLVAAAREPTREQLADAIAQTDTDHSWLPEGLDVETAADWLYAALHPKDGAK